jgi:hypothetical protein
MPEAVPKARGKVSFQPSAVSRQPSAVSVLDVLVPQELRLGARRHRDAGDQREGELVRRAELGELGLALEAGEWVTSSSTSDRVKR